MALADQLKRARADLVLERGHAAQKLAAIEIEAARIQASANEFGKAARSLPSTVRPPRSTNGELGKGPLRTSANS